MGKLEGALAPATGYRSCWGTVVEFNDCNKLDYWVGLLVFDPFGTDFVAKSFLKSADHHRSEAANLFDFVIITLLAL